MKKFFMMMVVVLAAVCAKADLYLYWNVPARAYTDESYTYARLYMSSDNTRSISSDTALNYGSLARTSSGAVATTATRIDNQTGYSSAYFYILLGNYVGEAFNAVAYSDILSYTDLASNIGSVQTTSSWSAGNFTAVPEPTSGLLLCFGAALLALRRKGRKSLVACVALVVASSAFADLYLAGDSTMCNYREWQYPQQGWGQALYRYMKNPAELHNWAVGGRSAKSFKNEGRWQKIVDALKPGDFVIVAFGHNDANKYKADRYSTPADYKELMRGFAADVQVKGATMVFATSIPHSGGIWKDADGKTHVRGGAAGIGPYVGTTCELAKELGLACLDLNAYACKGFEEMGADKAFKLYMIIAPGEYARFPNGAGDRCHTRDTGADFFARGAVQMCFNRKLPIAKIFKNPKDVVFMPIGFDGPAKSEGPMKDDFSKDEIAYANQDVADAEAAARADWRGQIMALRREARAKGMNNAEANQWAAAEFRRRQAEAAKPTNVN